MKWFLSMFAIAVIAALALSFWFQGSLAGTTVSALTCTELVNDGGFEAGGQGWVQYSKLGYPLVSSYFPRSGRLGAWLGGKDDADDRLTQIINLPGRADRITVNLWWSLTTQENPGSAFDFLQAGLYSQDGATQIVSLLDVNNESAEQEVWNPLSLDVSAYGGRTVQLKIEATTDQSNPTSFFVDDVSILSCVTATATLSPSVTATSTPTRTAVSTTVMPTTTSTATQTATPPPATPTATPSPGSPVVTSTLTVTPSATWPATATATMTPTWTPKGGATATSTATRTSGPLDRRLYLPVLLRARG